MDEQNPEYKQKLRAALDWYYERVLEDYSLGKQDEETEEKMYTFISDYYRMLREIHENNFDLTKKHLRWCIDYYTRCEQNFKDLLKEL